MHTVYEAADPVEAHLVCDLLRDAGIEASCLDQHAWGGRGDLPATLFPRVAVHRARDVARAQALLADYEKPVAGPDWRCPRCRETVAGTMAVCWNCGTRQDINRGV